MHALHVCGRCTRSFRSKRDGIVGLGFSFCESASAGSGGVDSALCREADFVVDGTVEQTSVRCAVVGFLSCFDLSLRWPETWFCTERLVGQLAPSSSCSTRAAPNGSACARFRGRYERKWMNDSWLEITVRFQFMTQNTIHELWSQLSCTVRLASGVGDSSKLSLAWSE